MTGWNFAGQNVTEADFTNTSLASSQLYSTASYQAKDIHGIALVATT